MITHIYEFNFYFFLTSEISNLRNNNKENENIRYKLRSKKKLNEMYILKT